MTFVAWAPGRVNLIGEHTDYSGGLVLPVAIQLGVELEVTGPAEDLDLVSEEFGPPDAGWGRYASAVAAELAELGRPPVGIRGVVRSTLPPGAGLSSSAALEVAVALALCEAAGWPLEPMVLAQACRRAEFRAVGAPVGVLDQAASLLGSEGHALLLDCGTLEHRLVRVPPSAGLVVVDSGVKHSHETSGYAARRAELEVGMPSRVRHVRTENERVTAFAAALEHADLPRLGEILLASHASLRDDYEVSVPELDALVERAVEAGAYGARLVGGGFGGSVLALVDAARADAFASELGGIVARPSQGAAIRRSTYANA
ncbi:MAG TPA: galactokinase family protein [Gaiellaceae bacterium]|jgi:galactokinase